MEYVKIVDNTVIEHNSDQMSFLGAYLIYDIDPESVESKISYLFDDNCEGMEGNFAFVDKESDMVIMGMVIDMLDDDPYENPLEISKDNLIYILKQWKSLRELRPREIIISREGDKYTVEGKDFPPMETLKDIDYN